MEKIKDYIVGFFIAVLVYPLSILLLPFFRIPRGGEVKFDLKVKPKAIVIPDFYRVWGEGLVGNQALFFSLQKPDEPYSLYFPKTEIEKIPDCAVSFSYALDSQKEMKTAWVTVETKKCLFGGYLPAKISNVRVVNEVPDWSK